MLDLQHIYIYIYMCVLKHIYDMYASSTSAGFTAYMISNLYMYTYIHIYIYTHPINVGFTTYIYML